MAKFSTSHPVNLLLTCAYSVVPDWQIGLFILYITLMSVYRIDHRWLFAEFKYDRLGQKMKIFLVSFESFC